MESDNPVKKLVEEQQKREAHIQALARKHNAAMKRKLINDPPVGIKTLSKKQLEAE